MKGSKVVLVMVFYSDQVLRTDVDMFIYHDSWCGDFSVFGNRSHSSF
jgi:hypothetical protein